MANRFSDIAKQMGAKVEETPEREVGQEIPRTNEPSTQSKDGIKPSSKSLEKSNVPINEIPTTRKTTALPLVLDIAIKEVKERRNIASKFKKSKKITEDDVVIEALEFYFKQAKYKSYLESAKEKLKNLDLEMVG